MIISASRRTDIPTFYTRWFINRIRAGYCVVPNPYYRNQVAYVYCYVTSSFERAKTNHEAHDPESPSLIGRYDARPPEKNKN